MSILNSVSDSQRSSRKGYRKLLNKLTNCFRHPKVFGREPHENSESDEPIDSSRQDYIEDTEEMKEYVRGFRLKVDAGLIRLRQDSITPQQIRDTASLASLPARTLNHPSKTCLVLAYTD